MPLLEYDDAFYVLANFLGALDHQLGSASFLAIVDTRSIFGDLKSQEPECANLAENAWFAYNKMQMLCSGPASLKYAVFACFLNTITQKRNETDGGNLTNGFSLKLQICQKND
ncbi:hypothetical protein AVEN_67622-1 [Araneus ventricosus]|uniref:Uncharacterized protein n=1 Tax=Araneus ventricosus TaxID=182803 RepID=A0A4Y2SV00_ARAVE|nr:hypothetical protein AVEN_67622-1 [Araneus ventricosus]